MSDMSDFITKLVLLKNEAGHLGLWKTMHRLEDAEKLVGWEVADKRIKDAQ